MAEKKKAVRQHATVFGNIIRRCKLKLNSDYKILIDVEIILSIVVIIGEYLPK
jgi:hypothetical protein